MQNDKKGKKMAEKAKVYTVIDNSMDTAKSLMEDCGWDYWSASETNFYLYKEFEIPLEAPIVKQFIPYMNRMLNASAEVRKVMKEAGSKIHKVFVPELGKKAYELDLKKDKTLTTWRVEFCPLLQGEGIYITFGHPYVNIPAFAESKVIDKYAPKEIIDQLLLKNIIKEEEIEIGEDAK